MKCLLLVAYQCGPGMGSVSQIGWEWYQRLSAERQVTLVTHVRNRAALDEAGAPLADSEILYIDTEWFAGPLYRLARRLFPRSEHSVFLVSSLDYFVFDFSAYRQLRRLLGEGDRPNWDLLHRVTPVTLAAPTWLGRLGLPLVLGPLNSGLADPPGFAGVMRQESTWLIRVRGLTRVLDLAMGSSRRAARILTATRATLAGVAGRHHKLCRMMPENGVDLARFQPTAWPEAPSEQNPLRVLFTGRLVPIKGLDMLIEAVARLHAKGLPVHLQVIGDGPMRSDWETLAAQRGLKAQVVFRGALPQAEVAARMRACHLFCLPSVRESGGAVLLEAMATARPVVALNYGGPGEIVDAEVGALLPLENPDQVIRDLVATLGDLFARPETWRERGQRGRQRIENHYSWPAKIAHAGELYAEVLAERSPACC
jgi:glycosyltransferase involved in cell wall biosynthesis